MQIVGRLINNIILAGTMFILLIYGIALMLSFPITLIYRNANMHDMKLYYEGFFYIAVSLCMWASLTEKPKEELTIEYIPDVRTPEEFYAKYDKMPEAIFSL